MSRTIARMQTLSAELAAIAVQHCGEQRRFFSDAAVFLNQTAARIVPHCKGESMSIVAEKITALETALTAERAKSADLQTQLTASQAEPKLDAEDQAAIDGVPAFIAALDAPADTTVASTGPDAMPALTA